jgi:hypothetical protein
MILDTSNHFDEEKGDTPVEVDLLINDDADLNFDYDNLKDTTLRSSI